MIRRVSVEDLKAFVNVYKEAYRGLEEYAYIRSKDIKWYFRWLMNRDRDGFFAAVLNDNPVGFIASDTNWFSFFEGEEVGEIHEIVVHPRWQNRGIGSSLMIKALDYIRSRNRKVVELWVGIGNYKAIRFYERFGFVKRGCMGRWLRMIKKL